MPELSTAETASSLKGSQYERLILWPLKSSCGSARSHVGLCREISGGVVQCVSNVSDCDQISYSGYKCTSTCKPALTNRARRTKNCLHPGGGHSLLSLFENGKEIESDSEGGGGATFFLGGPCGAFFTPERADREPLIHNRICLWDHTECESITPDGMGKRSGRLICPQAPTRHKGDCRGI